jgi:hypothetical protein
MLILVPAVMATDLGVRDVFTFGQAQKVADNEFIVPLVINHDEDLVAMDIPLEYTAGVTLTEVSFEGTAVQYFDIKLANIDAAKNRVTIGLINMVYEQKPALAKISADGSVVANLRFRVDDLTLAEFEIKPFESTGPSHDLALIYNDFSSGTPIVQKIEPEFVGGKIALSGFHKAVPEKFALLQNAPNPFNPSTVMAYDLPQSAHVRLEVFNILGQKVKTLVDGYQDAGSYRVVWNGDDDYGSSVASGIYFYRISAGQNTDVRKMTLIK